MRIRHLLAQKMELCKNRDIQPKRKQVAKNERMRLQTNLEFQQNEIKRLDKKYNVKMFSLHVRGGKADAAEQKIREFQKQKSTQGHFHQHQIRSEKVDM